MKAGRFIHRINSGLLDRAVKVVVIGVGGTGSHLACDLAVLSQTMLDLGHPGGLEVRLIDPDKVSEANCGRARFYPSDVGQYKASVLAHRINISLGMNFSGYARCMEAGDAQWADIVIGCVDTRSARRKIGSYMERVGWGSRMYLDCGNASVDGQVILGEFEKGARQGETPRLPHVLDLYPEMLDQRKDPVDSGPSCSRAEALAKQSAFVNKTTATHAINLLACLFREGKLAHHGVFFNCRTGMSTPLMCDTKAWQRFGYAPMEVSEPEETAA